MRNTKRVAEIKPID